MGYRVKPFTMSVRNNSTQEFIDVGLLGSDVDADISDIKRNLQTVETKETSLEDELNRDVAALQTRIDTEESVRYNDVNYIQNQLNDEVSTRISTTDSLQNQINQITLLPDGSTSGDAELTNIRVAADGTSYPSAGASVRAQVNKINTTLYSLMDTNGINVLSFANHTNVTAAGISYVFKADGSCSVTGTASGTSLFNYFVSETLLPPWIKLGRTYKIKFSATNITFRIYGVVNHVSTLLFMSNKDGYVSIPSNLNGIVVRLTVDNGNTVSATVNPQMLLMDTSEELHKIVSNVYKYDGLKEEMNLVPYTSGDSQTISGITFTVNDKNITVSGTSTSTVNYDLVISAHEVPEWFIPNKLYYFTHKSTSVYLRCYSVANNVLTLQFNTLGHTIFKISRLDGIIIRLVVESGTTVNEIIDCPTVRVVDPKKEEYIYPDFITVEVPTEISSWQDFDVVGNEVWFVSSSDDDHDSFNGRIYRVSKSDFSYIGSMIHNIGHMNSINYDSDSDMLITGNASEDSTIIPHVYVFTNVSDWSGSSVDFNNLNVIDFNLEPLVSTYGTLSETNACWGELTNEGYRFIYVNAYAGRKWFKIKPTVVNGSYTGAYTVIWSRYFEPYELYGASSVQVIQGMKLYKGRIIASVSHDPVYGAIYTPTPYDIIRKVITIDGSGLPASNEGCAVINDDIYFGNSASKKVFKVSSNQLLI